MDNQGSALLKNSNNLRVVNQLMVIDALRKKPQSCADMARSLSLSNVALKHITDELCAEGIIVSYAVKNSGGARGRRPNLYSLNDKLGVLCAIDLSGRDLKVAVASVDGSIIVRDAVRNILLIDQKALSEVAALVQKLLLSPQVAGRKLLAICISTPGEFDRETFDFIYAPRIIDYRNVNLKRYFEKNFHVEVNIYHDVTLGLVGEKEFGAIPKNANHVYFVYLDYVGGSSLLLNGKVYEGARGHAGEPASYHSIDALSEEQYSGRFSTIYDVYGSIHKEAKNHPEDPFYASDPFSFDEVVARFNSGDPVVVKAVELSARRNAIQLLAVANLLDLEVICLYGKMLDFGPRFRDMIVRYYRSVDANQTGAEILFGELGSDANLYGAIYQAGNLFYLNCFARLAEKRTNSNYHDIKNFFGDNI